MDGAIAQIEERLKKLLLERTTQALAAEEITSDIAIVGEGLALDSIALLEFVVGVEEDFQIFLDDSELTIEHFESLNTLSRSVETLLEPAAIIEELAAEYPRFRFEGFHPRPTVKLLEALRRRGHKGPVWTLQGVVGSLRDAARSKPN